MSHKEDKEPIYTKSSGNLFTDIGFPEDEAEELITNCQILLKINKFANEFSTPVKDLSCLLNIKTSEAVDIRKGRAFKFSTKDLEFYLELLELVIFKNRF